MGESAPAARALAASGAAWEAMGTGLGTLQYASRAGPPPGKMEFVVSFPASAVNPCVPEQTGLL